MKKIFLSASLIVLVLTGCENPIRMETKVYEDGSLDKTIVLEGIDKFRETSNMFGISASAGWTVQSDSGGGKDKYKIEFKKSFASVEEVNAELDKNLDTLFRVNSTFEKRFRWFYTYIRYSETVRPIDRFKNINSGDYFNIEDRAFIDRLPGEGTAISKADSLFLQKLSEKIFELYAEDAINNEAYQILAQTVTKYAPEKKWMDTLRKSKSLIYDILEDESDDAVDALLNIIDSLKIPLTSSGAIQDLRLRTHDFQSRLNLMSFARDAKYTNIIEMPWTVVSSNADSVAGNRLYYKPLVTKFAIQKYDMFAESRQLNLPTVIASVILILGTTILMIRSKKRYPS